ncbi:hypothetical protein GE061_015813 [Apolygus lucorum]|uniref:Uncharacterized protein n=1 Tax=Apolygus lucorum TaxID=248454 RepID=A0A6A4J8I1_APOLU|nr:hypothetical protein GE061_015811 [Apolygus lucorum]KAF6210057.1 hypothetical protein GE061_015813 [Apolygus lucorum]
MVPVPLDTGTSIASLIDFLHFARPLLDLHCACLDDIERGEGNNGHSSLGNSYIASLIDFLHFTRGS